MVEARADAGRGRVRLSEPDGDLLRFCMFVRGDGKKSVLV